MKNFQKNKIIGNIFANWLSKERLKKKYKVLEPQKKYIPDVDLILKPDRQDRREDLFLQLKQVIEWGNRMGGTPKTPQGVKTLIFKGSLFEERIKKVEICYYKRARQ